MIESIFEFTGRGRKREASSLMVSWIMSRLHELNESIQFIQKRFVSECLVLDSAVIREHIAKEIGRKILDELESDVLAIECKVA